MTRCRPGAIAFALASALNCRQAPAAITRKGYDALPAWCDCIRSRLGPEHIIMFVLYSLGVTLAGNSQAMRRETSLPQKWKLTCLPPWVAKEKIETLLLASEMPVSIPR